MDQTIPTCSDFEVWLGLILWAWGLLIGAMSQFLKNCSILRTKLSYEQQYVCKHICCKFKLPFAPFNFAVQKSLSNCARNSHFRNSSCIHFFPFCLRIGLKLRGKVMWPNLLSSISSPRLWKLGLHIWTPVTCSNSGGVGVYMAWD